MIKEAYGDAFKDISGVFEWHKLFCEDKERVEDDDRSRHPSASKINQNVSRVQNLLNSGRRMRIIADELSIPQTHVFDRKFSHEEESVPEVCATSVVTRAKGQLESDLPRSSCE
ncbi:uncharacterized protein TNCT_117311 [Trichonephila clavata]|uniref:Transposase n=1 Tax=Trichonephila clavata TaxID=2740835 RepID=A0A8X6HBC4_TRICU|nr:uncharacterized protein TNCT_117311 [Trichonephila clavata]